ncbi:fimbria/pilus outer membrane usher protein [Orbus mooreae]|uniref:fimbria/pilus outer membrane usher protein n=1 Tax=Orbus mooreae TaxID=3074107 RepID=UPI00370DACC9
MFCVTICSAPYSQYCVADDYFDPSLIEGDLDLSPIDLSVFNKKEGQLPGTYFTGIYLNQNLILNRDLNFDFLNNDKKILAPLLTKKEYIEYGVAENATPEFIKLADYDIIKDISAVIPDAFYKYNFDKKKLELSVPQIYINRNNLAAISETLWDDGVDALYTNYYYSGSTTKYNNSVRSGSDNNSYLNLRSGINFGAWRFRNYSTYSHTNKIDTFKNISSYLERNIASIKSQLTIGDAYTDGTMFDSFSFRGVKVASDEAMIPSNQRGFAPTIQGVAQSNAEITIRQSGIIIKQIYVSPGPFVINDLYPTSSNGSLEVTIKEANGSSRTFIQPFASVPIMLRKGGFKYSFTIGKYQSNYRANSQEPNFIQATGIYGLPYNFTVYSGTILSKDYKSVLLGIAKNLGDLGSISFDSSFADSTFQNDSNKGHSFRFQYSKDILFTGTTFSLSSYRYSTQNYREFTDINDYSYSEWKFNQNKKDKFQFNINQNLSENWGYLHLVGYQERYWNRKDKLQNIEFGYNNNYNDISYSVNYSYTNDYSNNKSHLFSLSVSIPMSKLLPSSRINITSSINDKSKSNSSIGLSGTAFDDDALNYNIQTSYANKIDHHASGSAQLGYKASFGEYTFGYNYSDNTSQYNYSTNGSVVVHPYGITFGQSLGETSILVRAKDAKNVHISNYSGIYTDSFGNAIVPYATPYEKNSLFLNVSSFNDSTDIVDNVKSVVPTRGAIVLADFQTQIGRKLYVTLTSTKIPFGATATITNENHDSIGIINDGQAVYLSGAPAEGIIDVKWSDGQCKAPYNASHLTTDIALLSVECN